MISEDFAFMQIERVSGLRFFPARAAGVAELAKALRAVATSEEQAEELVTDWIKNNREVPTPADFYGLLPTEGFEVPEL